MACSSSSPFSKSSKKGLELALGLECGSKSNSSHDFLLKERHHQELGLGSVDDDNMEMEAAVRNCQGFWWGNHYMSSSSSSVVLSSKTSSCSIPHHSPPPPQPGLWFSLRPSINRIGDVLPHVPKAFIRVKKIDTCIYLINISFNTSTAYSFRDENVTVFMVKTYLVRKLGLSNEAEVQISCMGQKLMHNLTLKHVRDAIWLPGLVEFLKSKTDFIGRSQGANVNYLMSLEYGRT
uniref:Uncharacterized protein LOC104223373 n=1 Tax=Nicotiana sylvestris TaxID=4096 RepID=A0A1U7VZA8_NICSY|nr:PREDICTED: uncharacterized protein LOC104223373 [Nicotiana sylvestris]